MIQARTESVYLIKSNKEKCSNLLQKKSFTENEGIDFFISLHIVMEVSLDALFRNMMLMQNKINISDIKKSKNIDSISFINKLVMFVYGYKYKFGGDLDKAKEYHSIIETLKDFSNMRNILLHGHSISTSYDADKSIEKSITKQKLQKDMVNSQIEKFKYIFDGLCFYIDHMDTSMKESGKNTFKQEYLDYGFLCINNE